MNAAPLTIWCNAWLPEPALKELKARLTGHHLIFPEGLQKSNLSAGGVDPSLAEADIAFGQPDPSQSMQLPELKWVHLTSAGYTRYDRDDLRAAFKRRGACLTNSSAVYAEPCAEHVFAMMMALARRLPQIAADQFNTRAWIQPEHRAASKLMVGQTVLILGFGKIASRLVELIQPLRMNIIAVRRRATPCPGCRVVAPDQTDTVLPRADHVVNILPANHETQNFMDQRRLSLMKPSALFYNIGRGTTVDQAALSEALQEGKMGGAYLDVTDPEPLPPDHPLWFAPNCYITPHTAGGHANEFERLVGHFADNFDRFVAGRELMDQII